MPKCPAGLATESLETAVAQAGERIGQSVTVRSRLWRQGTITTLLHCGHGDCCNSVGGGFILASRSLGLEEESQGFYIQPRKVAPHYGCYGDETLLCCDLEGRGQEVIAQGVITGSPSSGLGNGYALADAKFCIP